MRIPLAVLSLALCTACGTPGETREASTPPSASEPRATPAGARATTPAAPTFPVRIQGTGFIDAAGKPFPWRGVSAFRLAELISTGREADVVGYLDWAAARKLTVVRVLLMARHLFQLTPDAGRAALPKLLDLANARGLAVEVVALADTEGLTFDYEAHIREVGAITLEKGNAFVEIANEPGHPTQDPRLHDPSTVKRLADLLPARVIGAFGSAEYGDAYAGGDYATFHFPRHREWGHVLSLADAIPMLAKWKKPLINDEPIGAAAAYQAGRRDNSIERFGAAASLSEFIGLGATFHYEGGLQARLPDKREAACLDAWQRGIELVAGVAGGEVLAGADVTGRLVKWSGGRQAFGRLAADRAVLLIVDPAESTAIEWAERWTEERRATAPGALLITATRRH